jgi:signal transduction histidine kinase
MKTQGSSDVPPSPDDRLDDAYEPASKPIREGLPPTYRMRADAHYVEQLDASSGGPVIHRLSVTAITTDQHQLGEPIPALVDSVTRWNVLQPLIVQRQNGETRLIDGRKRLQAAIAAGLRAVPCLVRDIDDRESAALAEGANILRSQNSDASRHMTPPRVPDIHDTLIRAVADIDASTHLLHGSGSSLLLSLGADVIRAGLWRMSCLLHASSIVQHGVPPGHVVCSARRLVTSVVDKAALERRLRDFVLHTDCKVPDTLLIAGDPGNLGTALSALLLATFAVIEGRSGLRITLTASVDSMGQIEFAISEVGIGVSIDWETRAFDATWPERPGGSQAAIWMLAARTIAESYGGRVIVSAAGRGTTIKMVMPVAAA